MLSKEHKIMLAQLVYNERDLLFGECGPTLTKLEKQEKWNDIFLKLNSMGANIQDFKTLRDIEWSNMRRAAEKKLATIKDNEGKTDDEKINVRPLTNLDKIVLDVMGKGSGSTQKNIFDIPDGGSYLDPAQLARIKFEEDEDDDDFIDDNEDSNAGQGDDYGSRSGMVTRKRKKHSNAGNKSFTAGYGNTSSSGDSELLELRRKKLRLECSKLELEIERIPLECAKLELQIQLLQRDILSGHNNI